MSLAQIMPVACRGASLMSFLATPDVSAGQSGAALALMIFTFIFFWFVCGLSGFHTWLVATNQTTYENFRWATGQPCGLLLLQHGCACSSA